MEMDSLLFVASARLHWLYSTGASTPLPLLFGRKARHKRTSLNGVLVSK